MIARACNHPNVPSIPFCFALHPNHLKEKSSFNSVGKRVLARINVSSRAAYFIFVFLCGKENLLGLRAEVFNRPVVRICRLAFRE